MGRISFDYGLAPDFGGRLRSARKNAQLSQKQLSFEGCTAAYISRLEGNERTPSLQMLEQLARRLNVTRTWLLTGQDDPVPVIGGNGVGCTLCRYPLNERARHYAEGDFCEDVAGCRRRAFARLGALEQSNSLLRDAITRLLPAGSRTDDLTMAMLFPPETVSLLKSSTEEGNDGNPS